MTGRYLDLRSEPTLAREPSPAPCPYRFVGAVIDRRHEHGLACAVQSHQRRLAAVQLQPLRTSEPRIAFHLKRPYEGKLDRDRRLLGRGFIRRHGSAYHDLVDLGELRSPSCLG